MGPKTKPRRHTYRATREPTHQNFLVFPTRIASVLGCPPCGSSHSGLPSADTAVLYLRHSSRGQRPEVMQVRMRCVSGMQSQRYREKSPTQCGHFSMRIPTQRRTYLCSENGWTISRPLIDNVSLSRSTTLAADHRAIAGVGTTGIVNSTSGTDSASLFHLGACWSHLDYIDYPRTYIPLG